MMNKICDGEFTYASPEFNEFTKYKKLKLN